MCTYTTCSASYIPPHTNRHFMEDIPTAVMRPGEQMSSTWRIGMGTFGQALSKTKYSAVCSMRGPCFLSLFQWSAVSSHGFGTWAEMPLSDCPGSRPGCIPCPGAAVYFLSHFAWPTHVNFFRPNSLFIQTHDKRSHPPRHPAGDLFPLKIFQSNLYLCPFNQLQEKEEIIGKKWSCYLFWYQFLMAEQSHILWLFHLPRQSK